MATRREVSVRYEPNNHEFGLHMMSRDVLEAAVHGANDIVMVALSIAPRSEASQKGQGDGTRYVDHFEVVPDVVTINGSPRASATIVNDSDYAAQVEFGIGPGWSGSRPQGGHHGVPSRVLGEAGRKVGDYLGGPPG